jgi:RHS repeat-associated protein
VHTYDALGRPSATMQTMNEGVANTNYLSMVEYDVWSRPIRQTYRRGADQAKVFDSRYNDAGEFVRLERGALVLWQLAAQDAAQRPTGVTFGNHLTQTRTFDVNTGHLHDSALSTGGTALPLLKESYTYDLLGNVMSRAQHWNTGGFDEVFTYDDLNRLRTSALPGPGTQSFTYDKAGNLTSKTGVGTPGAMYVYPPPNGVHPHAVQSIAGVGAFTYDGFGNMLTGAGRVYTWNSFNMPISITKAGGDAAASSTFNYGPEHQRTRQTRGDGSVVAYAGAQEIETSSGGGATIKTYWPYGVGLEVDAPGKPTALSWVHKDRLGSPVLITDDLGAVREKFAYDAWGKRRQTDGSNTTPDNVDGVTDNKGYTGHEMLDQLDLVHMNGRVYDPFTARFVSADPFVQDPVNGQSYNRYSYVLNNPTNLIDPTGFKAQGCGIYCVTVQYAEPSAGKLADAQNRCRNGCSVLVSGFGDEDGTYIFTPSDNSGSIAKNGGWALAESANTAFGAPTVGGAIGAWFSNAGEVIKNGVTGGNWKNDAEMAAWGQGLMAAEARGEGGKYISGNLPSTGMTDAAYMVVAPGAGAFKTAIMQSAEKQVALSATALSVDSKLANYLLNAEHAVGGPKAKWFEQALGFNKSNMDSLSKQIVFNPKTAVETGVTKYGTQYNQVIPIHGANGRNIDVTFGWIRNNDGIVRLVTGIPTLR